MIFVLHMSVVLVLVNQRHRTGKLSEVTQLCSPAIWESPQNIPSPA